MRDTIARELLQKVKQDYAEIAGDFDLTRRGNWEDFKVFDDYLARGVTNIDIDFANTKSNGLKVLDIGCGNGRLKDYVGDKAEYFGTDNSKEFVEIAKERGDHFKVGDFLSLPYPDSEFDLVVSVAAFHHLPTKKLQLQALSEVARVMKPDAQGVFLVWNLWQRKYFRLFLKTVLRFLASFGKYGLRDFFVPWAKKTDRYYYAFTKRTLKKVLKKSGFKVQKVSLAPSKKNYYIVFTK